MWLDCYAKDAKHAVSVLFAKRKKSTLAVKPLPASIKEKEIRWPKEL